MIKALKIGFIIIFVLVFQVTIFPAYLIDPFQPNLMLVFIVWLGLRDPMPGGWCVAFLAGLTQDCFSGIYLGLHGFNYLFIYLLLIMIADFLYADSRHLLILAVFLATIVSGILQLGLLLLFSAATGLYATLLPGLIPQALINALAASILTLFSPHMPEEESR